MTDEEARTPQDDPAGGEAAAGEKPGEAAVIRPDPRPRTLSHAERENLRARLQKKFH
jgi:hypothetical protein